MTNHSDEVFSSLFDDELGEHDKNLMLEQLCNDNDLKCRWKRYQLVSDLLQNNLPPSVNPEFSKCVMDAINSETLSDVIPGDSETYSKSSKSIVTSIFSHPIFVSPIGKRLTGFAIAASVTVVALLGYQMNYQQQNLTPQMAEMTGTTSLLLPSNTQSFSVAQSSLQPNMQPQLVQMNPLAATTSMQLNSGELVTSSALPSASLVVDGRQVSPHDPKFNAQLHKYLINHNQHFSGTKLQGVMPYARIVVGSPTADGTESAAAQEKQ